MLSEKKEQLLANAIGLIADRGYGSLSMRALARVSDMKLGALQYHFPTWKDLLTSLAEHIRNAYRSSLEELLQDDEPAHIVTLADALMEDAAGQGLASERLLPQLWAMGMVEPIMGELLNDIYTEYLTRLEASLCSLGNRKPRTEALTLMTLIEGSTLFTGEDSPWASHNEAVRHSLIQSLKEKYGDPQ